MKRLMAMIAMLGAAVAAAGPLCEDERAALRFLDFVSAPMSTADEKEWWDIGGRQFGIFAKRYQIAFSGYVPRGVERLAVLGVVIALAQRFLRQLDVFPLAGTPAESKD